MDKEIVIDMSDLMARVEDDIELARELAEIFFDDVPNKIEELRQHISRNDAQSVRNVAHSLKGAAGNLSAVGVRKAALSLEKIGASGDLKGAAQVFSLLVSEIEAFKKAAAEQLGYNCS